MKFQDQRKNGSDPARTDAANVPGSAESGAELRAYDPPQLISSEDLEVAAANCDPPTGGFGKSAPACNPNTLGS
jgi:hypothetical protein